MKFVDGIQFRKRADQFSAAFAVQVANAVLRRKLFDKFRKRHVVNGDFFDDAWVDDWNFFSRDHEVDRAAFAKENRMIGIDGAAARNDAAQGRYRFMRTGKSHPVGHECAHADKNGIGRFAQFPEARMVLSRSPARGSAIDRSDFSIG